MLCMLDVRVRGSAPGVPTGAAATVDACVRGVGLFGQVVPSIWPRLHFLSHSLILFVESQTSTPPESFFCRGRDITAVRKSFPIVEFCDLTNQRPSQFQLAFQSGCQNFCHDKPSSRKIGLGMHCCTRMRFLLLVVGIYSCTVLLFDRPQRPKTFGDITSRLKSVPGTFVRMVLRPPPRTRGVYRRVHGEHSKINTSGFSSAATKESCSGMMMNHFKPHLFFDLSKFSRSSK